MGQDGTDNGQSHRRRVVVAGFGPVGRAVVNGLEEAGFEVTIVEMNARTVDRQAEMGRAVILGDIAEAETLRRADVEQADALILTIPDEDEVVRACRAAREVAPELFISARTNHLSKGMLANQAGANHVTVEEIVTAEAMQHAVLHGLQVSTPSADGD